MKSTFILLLSLSLALSTACQQNGQAAIKDNSITISYDQPIHGYSVYIYFYPTKNFVSELTGAAILVFINHKEGTQFTLTTNHFAISSSKFSVIADKETGAIIGVTPKSVELTYKEFELDEDGNIGWDTPPFFFYDLNFDGEKELIIKEFRNGPKDMNTYKAYTVDYGELAFPQNQITFREPYSYLNVGTVINNLKKELQIYHIGGFCLESFDIYQSGKYGTLSLSKQIEYRQGEDMNCYKHTYEIRGDKRVLISKELEE